LVFAFLNNVGRRKKRRRRYQDVEYYSLSPETKKGIIVILLFTISIISILSFLSLAGTAGTYIDYALGIVFGWGRYLIPLFLVLLSYVLARPSRYDISIPNYIGIFLFVIGLQGLLHSRIPFSNSFELTFSGMGGGIIGYLVNYPLMLYLGFWASLIILIGLLVAGFLLMFNTSFESILEKTNAFDFRGLGFRKKEMEDGDEEDDEEEYEEEEDEEEYEDESPTRVRDVKVSSSTLVSRGQPEGKSKIIAPKIKIDLPLSLLDDKRSKPTSGDIKVGSERIHRTLANFNIDVEMGAVQVGPTVTQYTLKPAEGIKLSKITTLGNDLALALAAHPIRIEAPIPGKSLVGIEVPNQKPAVVRIRETLQTKTFKNRKTNLSVALGKDVSGKCWIEDLSSMPHMLVAGATGSGKSVCLNAIIMSLLYQNNPDNLRFILVDPKRVEFPVYNGIPHLLTPVITDVTKTVYSLRWAISEMDSRFDTLAKAKKRNIASYNLTAKEKMPYIVIIIDELADLMVAAAAEVEGCIIRLTQMARAVGIHMVVATQRPSVDVITGLIKANIPCRVAFSVASLMDSRTILDSSGAEKLVGKGDCLFMTPQTAKPRRLQGAFVSDNEIKKVVDFLKKASGGQEQYLDDVTSKPSSSGSTSFDFKGGGEDDLFNEAKQLVIQAGKASASLLQRRLRVGYARAARLIDLLEDAGIVGPADGARPREILVDKVNAMAQQESFDHSQEAVQEDDEEEDDEEEYEDENTEEEYEEDDEENEEEAEDDEAEDDETEEEVEDEEYEEDEEDEEEEVDESPKKKKRTSTEDEIY